MRKERKMLHEIDETNDIRFRDPLTYQHLRIMAWIFLAIAQIGILLMIAGVAKNTYTEVMVQIGKGTGQPSYTMMNVGKILHFAVRLALPLFIVANFGVILSAHDGYKKLLVRFGVLSAVAAVMFFIFYEHFAVGLVSSFTGKSAEARDAVSNMLSSSKGFFNINLFLDLFLCTLVIFFLNYTPKKHFTGQKLVIFRAFTIFPILYEGFSVTLKIMAASGKIKLPVYLFPFITTKPPLEFVAFIAMAIFFKRRELHFLKNGKTKEEYRAFLDTNTNSFHFSAHAAVILAAAALLDLIILVILAVVFASGNSAGITGETVKAATERVMSLGFGEAIPLVVIAPIILLYSYNKKPKFPNLDLPITLGGVALIFAVYLECFYQVARIIAAIIGRTMETI